MSEMCSTESAKMFDSQRKITVNVRECTVRGARKGSPPKGNYSKYRTDAVETARGNV